MDFMKKKDAGKKLNESKVNDNKIIKELNKNEIKEKDDLTKKYVDEGMSIQKISNIYKCGRKIIYKKLREYDIPIRPRGSFLVNENGESLNSKKLKGEISNSKYNNIIVKNKGYKNYSDYQKYLIEEKRKKGESPKNCMWTRDEIINLYHEQNLTAVQIGKLHILPVGDVIIGKWIDIYGIEKKTLLADDGESLSSKLTKDEISRMEYYNECAKNKGHKNVKEYQKYLIEEKRRKGESPEKCMWTKEELEDIYAYDKQNLSPMQIGKIHDPQVNAKTILNWIDIFGIERKTWFEIRGGENSPLWQGGISNGPYCEEFTSEVKEYERERWYKKCVLCNKTEEEEGRKLSVHHVDYNKNQGCDYIQWKLIPLCKSCNGKANGNRNYYEHLFTNFIIIRKTLEEFEWKIDYKSIGTIDERCDILDKLKYKNKKIYNDFKYDWRSIGI